MCQKKFTGSLEDNLHKYGIRLLDVILSVASYLVNCELHLRLFPDTRRVQYLHSSGVTFGRAIAANNSPSALRTCLEREEKQRNRRLLPLRQKPRFVVCSNEDVALSCHQAQKAIKLQSCALFYRALDYGVCNPPSTLYAYASNIG